MIKLKFALSLSINSKSQTQHLPKWMCFTPLKNKQGPASFAHRWDLGEEVPFELNLLGFQHKSLRTNRTISDHFDSTEILASFVLSFYYYYFFKLCLSSSQWNRSSPFYVLKQIIMGFFRGTYIPLQQLLTY